MTTVPSPGTLRRALLLAALSISTMGCALTSKSEPLAPRYFSPERSGDGEAAEARATASAIELKLGRVSGASYLDERLVYRDSRYELGYYQERRWTEEPAHYLARRLSRVLFEQRGIRQVVGGAAPTLEVELTAFEEIRSPSPIVRVGLVAKLHDQRLVRWAETLTVEQPIVVKAGGDLPDAIVEALATALRGAVDRIADRVLIELSISTPPDPSPARGKAGRVDEIRRAAEAAGDRR
jgi:cholesterol transport system auxiliary component